MCKWMDKVVDGVDVFQVGKQQLWNMVGWTREGYRAYAGVSRCGCDKHILRMDAESLAKGMWLVVELAARFGRMSAPVICHSYTSMCEAVSVAARFTLYDAASLDDYKIAHCYEVWHIVDDGDLWHEWDNASAAYIATHQPEVTQYQPVIVDEQDMDYGRYLLFGVLCGVCLPADYVLEALLQLCEAGEQYEYASGYLSGSLARAEAFVDA